MVYNEIGKTGMKVSNLSFGASSLGGVFHGIREEEGIRAVHVAVDNGINFIDARFLSICGCKLASRWLRWT